MAVPRKTICVALLTLLTAGFLGLGGCSGGGSGGGGGGGGGGAFLTLVAPMFMGQKTAGGTSTTPYPVSPAGGVPVPTGSGQIQVPAAVFALPALGTQSYIELRFNTTVLASSIFTGTPGGNDGIELLVTANGPGGAPPCVLSPGLPVCLRLDTNGVLDPTNAVINGVAPSTLRLYYDPDNNLTTPDRFPNADYALIITNNLKSSGNGPYCVDLGSTSCANDHLPYLPFTIGPNTTALAMASVTPVIPVNGEPAAPINSEIALNFVDSVDFPTIVGGAANLTTLDPFISVPFSLAAGATPAPNVTVAYTAPTDPVTGAQQTLPATLGFILYMPDPVLNPALVRVRFVDLTGLQPVNNLVVTPHIFQNYASNPLKFPITSSDPAQNGATLQLPAIKAVPGSFLASNGQIGPATVAVTIPITVTDRANVPGGTGNALAAAYMSNFTWAAGPPLARNPVPPDATFVGSLQGGAPPFDHAGLTVVDTAATTTATTATCTNFGLQASVGGIVTGVLTALPPGDRLASPATLGSPGDIEVGAFLNPANSIADSPRGTLVAGVPNDQNGTAPNGIRNCVNPMIPPPAPPYGNRLYVTDLNSLSLKVFNSYDFSLITTISGVASPRGLGMAPDLSYLYVSNELQGTIQRININPLSPNFHTITNTITVGSGPRAISVQPNNEEVFVCNYLDNSISVIRANTQAVRATFPVGFGPSDCFITLRMLGQGLTNEYMAFIPNTFSNTVSVYESAGGMVVHENLPDGRITSTVGGFLGPARGTWNWQTYINFNTHPGCFIANTLGSSVDHLLLNNFTLSPPPGFPGPAGTRVFVNTSVFSAFPSPSDASIDNMSGGYNWNANGINNNKSLADPSRGGGIPSVVVVSYPSLGMCVAYDYNSPAMFSSVSVPGCDFLQAYYDQ